MDGSSRHHTVLLLLLRQALTLSAIHGDYGTKSLHLNCTNDFDELISCQLRLRHCTDHSLTLQSNLNEKANCSLRLCETGLCCCPVQMMLLSGGHHRVTVWDGETELGSKTFGVWENVKPNTPTIISVNEIKGNLEIMWDTNTKGFIKDRLKSELTYYKKGDPVKNQVPVTHSTVKGLCYYKLPGRYLEPSTSYVFSVRSISTWNSMMSNSSAEYEFKTSAFSDSLNMVVIISLSIAAVILSSAFYFCFVKFKAKWWDSVEQHPSPKLWILHSSQQEVLKPVPPLISSISLDPFNSWDSYQWSKVSLIDPSSGDYQKKSRIRTGSSDLRSHTADPVHPGNVLGFMQKTLLNAFTNINLIQPLAADPLMETRVQSSTGGGSSADGLTSGPPGFINKTYTICLPNPSPPPPSAGQDHTEMPCDLDYHPIDNLAADLSHQQESKSALPALQNLLSTSSFPSTVMTDMSYQPCTANPGMFMD